MKKTIILSFFFLFYQFTFGQIDTELIKKNVTENPEENFYSILEVFKTKPLELTQEQLNQLYYGSKFVNISYTIGDYNSEFDTFWKPAKKRLSKSSAEKIFNEAENKYLKNPLNKDLLDDMINIYSTLSENQKADLCALQKKLIIQTIEKSGDGKTEETAICVIIPGEVLEYLGYLIKSEPTAPFDQQMKQLSDGSILTIYKVGSKQIIVKLVGGYFYK